LCLYLIIAIYIYKRTAYAGKNFTDRQRIKRKAEHWAKNYQALPKAERLTLLAAIMAVEAKETD